MPAELPNLKDTASTAKVDHLLEASRAWCAVARQLDIETPLAYERVSCIEHDPVRVRGNVPSNRF
jgi:hypothetical protein